MTATSSAYRRKNDDLSSPIPNNYLDDHAPIPVFASAVPSYSGVQRRAKGGSGDARSAGGLGFLGQSTSDWTVFASGWKDYASSEDNIWDNEPSASSSTSSFDPPSRPAGPSTKNLSNGGLMSSPSHPLSSPTRAPRERWSQEEFGSEIPSRPTSRRTNSDDSLSRGTWSRTHNGKGKGRMTDEELDVIVHEVSACPLNVSPAAHLMGAVPYRSAQRIPWPEWRSSTVSL
jgi:hypothetical protein